MPASSRRALVAAAVGYVLLAVASTWPLAPNLGTHLTGRPSGDTGVYAWNLWVFHYELVERGHLPFFTDQIFSLTPRVDLGLHNYTTFSNLIALPLFSFFDSVTTFNLVYLIQVALAGFAMFLLARRLTGDDAVAWLAGAAFCCSPVLVARSTAHFSLVAAAPLPIFILLLRRAVETQRASSAVAVGVAVACAALSDVYYGVYCLVIGAAYLAARVVRVHLQPHTARAPSMTMLLNIVIVLLAGLILGVGVRGGGRLDFLGLRISMRTLYTPMLALSLLVLVRLLLALRPRLQVLPFRVSMRTVGLLASAGVTFFVLLSPVMYAVSTRVVEGRYVSAPVLWRSSAAGVDLLAMVIPNPMSRLLGAPWRDWLSARPEGFAENVASPSFVAIGIVVLAWVLTRRLSKRWTLFTVGFAWLSLGPFVQVAGVNTSIPTPWTFLRYAPLIGSARMPTRFIVLATLGLSVLFALALAELLRRYPHRRRAWLAATAALLALELAPVPRELYAASVPAFYENVAKDPRDVKVLGLPLGIRDGLSSIGNINARAQFHQTVHHKPIVGGYLSRVSPRRAREFKRQPVLDALLTLSEGKPLEDWQRRRAWAVRERFVEKSKVGYVTIDRQVASPELIDFAIAMLNLRPIAHEGRYSLYAPIGHRPDGEVQVGEYERSSDSRSPPRTRRAELC